MSMIGFENRVAVVTGAGEGIGWDYALDLARRGAGVVVNDIGRDADGKSTAEKVVEEISSAGGRAAASLNSIPPWSPSSVPRKIGIPA